MQLVGNLCPGYGWESSISGPKTAQAPEVEPCINESAPNITERWIFVITLRSFPTVVFSCLVSLSPHTPNQQNSSQRSPETDFFWWMFSQCWCEILINLCLQYISYSSLTWTCLEYSKAAVWSLLLQGPQVLPQNSHKAASVLNEVSVLKVVDISGSWRGTWKNIHTCRKTQISLESTASLDMNDLLCKWHLIIHRIRWKGAEQ